MRQSRFETRNANCSDVRVVASGSGDFSWLAWNPIPMGNQREIAFTVGDPDFRIDVVNEDATNRRTLVPSGPAQSFDEVWAPAYSRDGKYLAFLGSSGSINSLIVANSDGSNPMPLPLGATVRESIVWTPDGTAIGCKVERPGYSAFHFYPVANGVLSATPVTWPNSPVEFCVEPAGAGAELGLNAVIRLVHETG